MTKFKTKVVVFILKFTFYTLYSDLTCMMTPIKFILFIWLICCIANFGCSLLNCYSCEPSKECGLKNISCPKRIQKNSLVRNFVGKTSCFTAVYKVFGEKFIHKGCSIDISRSPEDLNFVTKNEIKIKEGLNILPNVEKTYFSCHESFCNSSKRLANSNLVLLFSMLLLLFF